VFVAAWLESIDTGAVAWSADTRGWTIDRGRVPRWLALV
jgi:hypothetical protein